MYVNKSRNRIKELRIAKGFNSMREFVRYINDIEEFEVSTATISLLEAHKRENPSWELVDFLCGYFGVTADYLMGRTDYNIKENEVKKIAGEKPADKTEMEIEMKEFYKKMRKKYAGEFTDEAAK